MTKRQKTTKAVHKTARLNPIHKLEREVLEVIAYWESKGVNFKQLVVDRIGRYDKELTPEFFVTEYADDNNEELLKRYTDYLLEELKTTGYQPSGRGQQEVGGDNTGFSLKLAQGFQARRKQGQGDDD